MAGGSLGLASSSASGLDLTNVRPQVTFFKKVFKRHTNFGIESIQQSEISGTANFGSSVLITIEKTATLITDMYMEFNLPPVAGTGGVDASGNSLGNGIGSANGIVGNFKVYADWVNAVGYAIIEQVELIIDGNTIDKHTGLWYDIWNELTDPNRKEWPLVGKRVENSDFLPGITDTTTRYYVPLKFFFNRNPGLALPIFVINENKIKVKITFKSLLSLITFDVKSDNSTTIDTSKSMSNFKFFTTYIYLETDEETRISNTLPAEYLIETLKKVGPVSSSSTISNMTFENPTKEFIWVFRHKDRLGVPTLSSNKISSNTEPTFNVPFTNQVSPNDIFNYSGIAENTSLGYGTYDPFQNLVIKIRNQNRIESTDSTFFRTLQPYKHHSNTPGGIERAFKKRFIYCYSFALNPEEYQPSGSYNFGRLNDKTTFQFTGANFTDFRLDLFLIQYEYLSITSNSVTLSSVPTQTYVDSSLTDTSGGSSSGGADAPKRQAQGKQKTAVVSEIKKRYTAEIPHVHVHEHAHIHKKKWTGLQGQFLTEQKRDDLGKDRLKKI